MAQNPKISVVMPTHNRANTVHHAIQSIIDQTFDDWELIIVDDGSTDNTEKVVKLFADSRIRYVKNKTNRGISYTRNRGNKLARADIIVVQDDDDMSFPDRLEEIYKYFLDHPETDYLYHWAYIRAIDIRNGARAIHREIHRSGPYDKRRAITVPYIPGQSAYKRSIALKLPYRTNLVAWDDWGLIIDFSMHNKRFGVIERPLYEYVISADSITTLSDNDGRRDEDKKVLETILRKEYKLDVN